MEANSVLKSLAKYVLLCAGAIAAFGAEPKIARDLEGVDPASTVDVIVRYAKTPTAENHQRILDRGGKFKRDLSIINAGHYSLPASALSEVAKDSDVVAISPDRAVRGLLDLTADAVNAHVAWQSYGLSGNNIGVAVIDSGIATGRDLPSSQVVYSQSFVGGGTQDAYGHGTHVAGILASDGHSSSCNNCFRTFLGIASGVNLINLRVLDQNGNGTDSNVIAALQTAVSLRWKYNIQVINLSLGRPVFESYTNDPLCQAVEAAWKAGIVVVVAAGNDGRDNSEGTNGYMTITAPGNDPYVITVGAMKTEGTPTRTDDLIASYSSKGPTAIDHIVKPDLVAPGNNVVSLAAPNSTLANLYPGNETLLNYYESGLQGTAGTSPSSAYFTLSGTSMATPVVSGAVA